MVQGFVVTLAGKYNKNGQKRIVSPLPLSSMPRYPLLLLRPFCIRIIVSPQQDTDRPFPASSIHPFVRPVTSVIFIHAVTVRVSVWATASLYPHHPPLHLYSSLSSTIVIRIPPSHSPPWHSNWVTGLSSHCMLPHFLVISFISIISKSHSTLPHYQDAQFPSPF